MPLFKVITTCEAISEYTVEANSAKEAEEQFYSGDMDLKSEEITDYRDEQVIEVNAVKE